VWTFLITMLASLYPAWFAARLQPVDALHSL
jgi:ABC-type lipoprotein release transport system permease subunit